MKDKKRKQSVRQSWEPHGILKFLRALWMIAFSAAKIALGAVATVLCIVVVCMFIFVGLLGNYLENDVIPNSTFALENFDLDQTSFMYYVDENGDIQQLQRIYTTTNRQWASYEEFPQELIDAAVAIEDKRFFEHQGVDWITTVKACVGMFMGGNGAGGSTITQQLIKNMTEEDSVTVQRKVMEWFRAAALEKSHDKKVIMEYYLNTIYLGEGCFGIKSAAAKYFGKEIQMLTAAECASLVSITNNPSIFGPYMRTEFKWPANDPDAEILNGRQRNKIRQETVLWQMHTQGLLTDEEYDQALNQELVFKNGISDDDRYIVCENEGCGYGNIRLNYEVGDDGKYYCPNCASEVSVETDASQAVYSWFVDTTLEDVAKAFAAQDGVEWNSETKTVYLNRIQRGGYHIYTTLDMKVQNQVDAIYKNLDEIPGTRSAQQLQSAIVVIDNRTGDIEAMAGGVGDDKGFDDYNRAEVPLQVGSSMKPLAVYAPTFEMGAISPATVILDLPLRHEPIVFPRNDNRKYSYSRTIFSGVVSSVNAVAVNTLDMIGTTASYNFAKNKFRLNDLTDNYVRSDGFVMSDIDYAPLGMGALTRGASVRDMTSAFGTFANDGIWREGRTFTKVYDSEGNLVLENVQESEQILTEKTINYMNYCLAEAVSGGTGTSARLNNMMVCGKTGTTSNNRDRYFCGFTGYYTAAVWCGYDQPEQIYLYESKNPSAVLWKKVMAPLHQGKQNVKLYDTDGMAAVTVCLDSGMLATDACKNDVRSAEVERTASARAYKEDRPTKYCDKHVEVEFCITGNGVASDYCKLFAAAGAAEIAEKALVKFTQEEVEAIQKASKAGLQEGYVNDSAIYLVDKKGKDLDFHGLKNNANKNVSAPYIVCPVHNKQAWDAYQASQQPVGPVVPGTPTSATPRH